MQLIIKTKGSQPIDDRDKRWAEAKFRKLGKFVPAETIIEVTLEDLYGPKRGNDKKVHVLAELPHTKEPFHLEEVGVQFRKTISIARDRFERYLKKYHDRTLTGSRFPRKYWFAKLFERFGSRAESPTDEV